MSELFGNFAALIVFLHVISAVIWVGGMIALRFAIHYSMQEITEANIKLERTLKNLKYFFSIVIPSIIILLFTAVIMIIALGFKGTSLYSAVILKEAIWTIMTIIFLIVFIKRNKAQLAFEKKDFKACKEQLLPIAKYFIPINIFLGVIAIYLGVVLRGF